MPCKVVTTQSFDERFEKAVGHRHDVHGSASARRLLDAYDQLVSTLQAASLIGTVLNKGDRIPDAPELRWVLLSPYVVVYRYLPDNKTLVLENVFFSSSNWRELVERPRSAR